MFQESIIDSPLLAGLAITLIHFIWQGVLVALVLKALLSLISYQKSQLRYALSTLAMFANLCLPLITFFLVYDIDYRQATSFVHALPLLDQNFYLEQITANAWYMEWLEHLPALAILWLSIVIALTLKLIIELYNVNKLPLQGCSPADVTLQKRFDALIAKVGISRNVALLLSNKTDVPMAIGWLKPVVLIPFSMLSGLTPQQLDMLLLHELAHIRRHDYLVNFLQTLVEILLFFHPAVRWVSKQMRNEREYCSDDIAVEHGGCSVAYAHTLADTASLCEKHRHRTIPSMAMAASGGDLKQRVVRLLDDQQHCTKSTDSGKWLASFTILFAIVFLLSNHSLTLPVIDLQSGSISLHNTTKELNKSSLTHAPLTFQQENTNTSLASQLLAIDNVNADETASLNNPKATDSNLTGNQNIAISKKPQTKSFTAMGTNTTTPYYDELPIVRVNKVGNKKVAQLHAELKNATQVNENLNVSKSKSISELAFERTDSKRNATKESAYSKQLSSLISAPKAPSVGKIVAQQDSQTNLTNNQHQSNLTALQKMPFNSGKLSSSAEEKLAKSSVKARLLNSVEPKYPSSAKRKGIELEIMVEFNIDKNGFVKNIQFESKSRVNYFRNAIRNAMEEWRFLPAKKNGRAVESKMSKIFSFSLLK